MSPLSMSFDSASTQSPGLNTTINTRHHTTLTEDTSEETMRLLMFWLGFVATLSVSSVGVLGNVVSFWVWQAQTSYNATTFLFKSLAVWDTVFLLTIITSVSLYHYYWPPTEIVWLKYGGYFGRLARLMSVHTTLMVTVSRWVAVRYPLHAPRLLTRKRVWLSCLVVFVWCVVIEMLTVFTWLPALDFSVTAALLTTHAVIGQALPLLVLLVFNACLLRKVHRRSVHLGQMRTVTQESSSRWTDTPGPSGGHSQSSTKEAGQNNDDQLDISLGASNGQWKPSLEGSGQGTIDHERVKLDPSDDHSTTPPRGTGQEQSQRHSNEQVQDSHEKQNRQLQQPEEKPLQPQRDDEDDTTDHPHHHQHHRHLQQTEETKPIQPQKEDGDDTTDHSIHRRQPQRQRSAVESRRQRVTTTVLCVSVSSFIAYPVSVAVKIFAFWSYSGVEGSFTFFILISVTNLCQVINSGINVVFYAALISKFRHLAELRLAWCRRLFSSSSCRCTTTPSDWSVR